MQKILFMISKQTLFLLCSILITALFSSCNNTEKKLQYIANTGEAHGTYYNIKYEYFKDIQNEIDQQTAIVDSSLSTYAPTSIISQINQDKPNVKLDSLFIKVFYCGKEVFEKTNGAFDMTVTPVVNAWGFGFTDSTHIDSLVIDSLLQYVNFDKIKIDNNKIVKEKPEIMLDGSAIAKGFSVDFVAEYLEKQGIKNYLVEIGGEVRTKGVNDKGEIWTVGIDKPLFNQKLNTRELQEVVSLNNRSIATSGNYRQYYFRDSIMYSHTINPKTGYPVQHSLLSASVIAPTCMLADAYATAFMVLGVDKALEIAEKDSIIETYLIYQNKNGEIVVKQTKGFLKQ